MHPYICTHIFVCVYHSFKSVHSIHDMDEDTPEFQDIISSYKKLKDEHSSHLNKQMKWWDSNFRSQDLPSIGFQKTGTLRSF